MVSYAAAAKPGKQFDRYLAAHPALGDKRLRRR
jgi:hypothetical protein